ncbi:MAG: response regulator [Proteocatella sp.]
MNNIRVMIVDDSSFSISFLKNMIQKIGLEVVGTAQNLKDAVAMASEIKPDLITMDMTLPDGDGIECSKLILKEHKDIKIVVISSMMDEEIIKKAKKVGVKAYLQKPLDQEDLSIAVDRIFSGDELYSILEENYKAAFKEAIYNYLKRTMGGEPVVKEVVNLDDASKKSAGISVAVGIIGRHSGRFIVDMSDSLALDFTKKMAADENMKIEDAVIFLSEFANIISGNACSLLNTMNKSLGLRVSPPMVFHGKDLTVNIGGVENRSFLIDTDMGEMFMNVGFKKEEEQWM